MSKIKSSLWKLSGEPKTTSSIINPVQQASTPGITPSKAVSVGLVLDGSITDGVLIKHVKTVAAVHEDSREMESIDDWIEDQGGRTSMMDTGRVVSAIEGDRTSRPRIEFWGDRLDGVDVP